MSLGQTEAERARGAGAALGKPEADAPQAEVYNAVSEHDPLVTGDKVKDGFPEDAVA